MPISSGFSFVPTNSPSSKRIIPTQIVSRAPKVNLIICLRKKKRKRIENEKNRNAIF